LSLAISLQIFSDGMADPASYGSLERDIEQVSFAKFPFLFSLSCFLILFLLKMCSFPSCEW